MWRDPCYRTRAVPRIGLPSEASGSDTVMADELTTVIVIVRTPTFGVAAESWASNVTG